MSLSALQWTLNAYGIAFRRRDHQRRRARCAAFAALGALAAMAMSARLKPATEMSVEGVLLSVE